MDERKEDFLKYLDKMITNLKLIKEDKEVQKRLKDLLELEIDFHAFLLALEYEKTPSEEILFGEKTESKLKMGWKDWVGKIFKKLNSLLGSLIPIGKAD